MKHTPYTQTRGLLVAPLAGAWIETIMHAFVACLHLSLPSRERGLKPEEVETKCKLGESLPSRERGLKPRLIFHLPVLGLSLPSRERGLKLIVRHLIIPPFIMSLPSRERGLKLLLSFVFLLYKWSLPSRERGLKPRRAFSHQSDNSRSPRGSVD